MENSYKEKFNEQYENIQALVQNLEPERKKMLFTHRFIITIMHLFFVTFVILFFKMEFNMQIFASSNIADLIVPFSFTFLGLIFFYYFLMKIFKINYYPKKFAEMVKVKCFDNLVLVFDFIKNAYVEEFSFCPLYKKLSENQRETIEPIIDDNFEGCYKGVKFSITEVANILIRERMGSYIRFNGIILKYQFNKSSKTSIYLSPRFGGFGLYIMIALGIFMTIGGIFEGPILLLFGLIFTGLFVYTLIAASKNTIVLEDNSFHKKFYVEASDQIEARYILTPSFMERLKNLQTAFGAKNITCMIEGSQITFAIKTNRDLFEIGNLNIPVTSIEQVKQFYDEITAICDIIDHFKLNERTGL